MLRMDAGEGGRGKGELRECEREGANDVERARASGEALITGGNLPCATDILVDLIICKLEGALECNNFFGYYDMEISLEKVVVMKVL